MGVVEHTTGAIATVLVFWGGCWREEGSVCKVVDNLHVRRRGWAVMSSTGLRGVFSPNCNHSESSFVCT